MIINFVHNSSDTFTDDNIDLVLNYNSAKNLHYTFWESDFVPANWYSKVSIDLLYISLSVYAADKLCKRSDADDAWSRELKLYIPVLQSEIWTSNKDLLEDILNFLSGDKWTLEFRPRTENDNEKYYMDRWNKKKDTAQSYNIVCMLSGGLDSYIGAIDLLETKKVDDRVMFVSHYGGGKGTKEYQDCLINKFCVNYDIEKKDFQQFHAAIIDGVEDTTRTRSLIFFAHAIALASTLGKSIPLIVPENGLISLNIPSTFSRIGTSSTRTTHPFYIKKLQELLNVVGLPITINNPYQFKTKGEMMFECKGQVFMKENVSHTMSCSHPDVGRRRGEKQAMHCGYCLPCVIRKAALKKSNVIDNSEYYDPNFEKVDVAIINLNSYRQGLKRFNPKYAFMTIQQNGPITDNIDNYTELYIRGMKELEEYIKGI